MPNTGIDSLDFTLTLTIDFVEEMPAEGIEPSISALHRVICHLPLGINAHICL